MKNPTRLIEKILISILLAFGAAKIYAITGKEPVLETEDPIIQIQYRHILLLLGMFELTLALVILKRGLNIKSAFIVMCSGLLFLLYHAIALYFNISTTCPCMGFVGRDLGISKENVAGLSAIFAAILTCLAGAYLYRKPT